MGFFSKKKNEDIGFIVNTEDDGVKLSGDKNLAPHAMTAEEVSGLWVFGNEQQSYAKTSALDSLKKRMSASTNDHKEEVAKPTPSSKTQSSPVVETQQTVFEKKAEEEIEKIIQEAAKPIASSNDTQKNNTDNKTLVEKVKRYTLDEQGRDMSQNQEPIYELQSVAEILENNGKDAMKNLSEKYGLDFSFDDLGKNKKDPAPIKKPESNEPVTPPIAPIAKTSPTPIFEQLVNEAEIRENRELYESLFKKEEKKETPDISVPDISDIDTREVGISNENPISNTATIRFTPIKDSKGNTDHITISNVTKHIDLGDTVIEDISSHSAPDLEQSEFDKFSPSVEYNTAEDGRKILLNLAKQKRFYFLAALCSAFATLVLLFFLLPPIYNFIISNPKSAMVTCTIILSVSILANVDMFFDFKNLFSQKCRFDVLSSLCAVATLSLGITATITKSNAYYAILLCAIILFVRAICRFRDVSAQHKSLRRITGDREKNAVTLIGDPATTFAMVKNAIDGNVLVATSKKSHFIKDFMKHFEFYSVLNGKVSIVFYVALGLSLLCGIMAYFYYNSIFHALFTTTSISCLAAMPTVFFIDSLPFTTASKKLNAKGGMIAGNYGAEKIENANAAVVNINDIFPEGTVTMHDMHVLANNNIDEILLRAASLTAAVGSPLQSIFERIAGTNTSYSIPDSDTVKYEKNLGISGWVDNEPLFIGNRSLMTAHGINTPSLEVDKKILRKGYFPVYVATSTAACALIVIQYNVDPIVAKQLHKITDLGILLLVENCDPNVTDAMLCDYFGLYDDSVKIMTNTGLHMYKNSVQDVPSCSAPAVFRGSGLNFIQIINCASSIKKCNRMLTVLYAIFAIIGALGFVYSAFSGSLSLPAQTTVLIYTLATTLLSIIGFLIRKP